MKNNIFKIIFISLSSLLIGICLCYFNLNVGEQAQQADVIIVPEGPGIERAQKSVDLLNKHYSLSGKIIVSPFINEEYGTDFRGHYQGMFGAKSEDLIQENDASSTWSNVVLTLELMKKKGYHSALIVSSDYHTRRVRLAYERVNQNYNFDLTYVSAYPLDEDGKEIPYWDHPNNKIYALNELPKLIGYMLGLYHFIDL